MKSSHLELAFETLWKQLGSEFPFVREYRFFPPRLFRFDFAWPERKVAVEIEGGIYGKGRHTSVNGYNADCEKYNLATLNGWRVLRFTERMLTRDPVQSLLNVNTLLEHLPDETEKGRG